MEGPMMQRLVSSRDYYDTPDCWDEMYRALELVGHSSRVQRLTAYLPLAARKRSNYHSRHYDKPLTGDDSVAVDLNLGLRCYYNFVSLTGR